MNTEKGTAPRLVDITPTWAAILPVLLTVIEDGSSADSRRAVKAELLRMAQIADAYVAEHKGDKK